MKSKKFQAFVTKLKNFAFKTLLVLIAVDVLGWSMYYAYSYGYSYAKSTVLPVTVYAKEKVEVEKMPNIPIFDKIIQCESGGSQFDKNGQVLMHANSNKSVDVGIAQINVTTWGKKAKELGYDLTKSDDNKAFGLYLFLNYGDAPWSASQNCWSK